MHVKHFPFVFSKASMCDREASHVILLHSVIAEIDAISSDLVTWQQLLSVCTTVVGVAIHQRKGHTLPSVSAQRVCVCVRVGGWVWQGFI